MGNGGLKRMTKIEALRTLRKNLDSDYPEAKAKMRLLRWNDAVRWADGSLGRAGGVLVTAKGYRAKEYNYSECGQEWSWK
jgi:hypothetical protein